MLIYFGVLVAILGLVFGSFLNCTAMRLVRGEDFVKGRSRCPSCGHELSAIELIPVLSFILQKGKCRHCGGKISARYIVSEIVFAALSLGLYFKLIFGAGDAIEAQTVIFLRNWILTGCLFLISLTDLESMEIFDGVLIFGFVNFLVFAAVQILMKNGDIYSVILSLLAGLAVGAVMLAISLIMDRILKRDSMGGGDIKLYALLGVYLGFAGAYELVILSCIIGLIFAGVRKILFSEASKEFSFGPAIALAGYILLLSEEYITGWYLSIIL